MLKIGSIIRIKKEYSHKYWYTTKTFKILGFSDNDINICYLDSKLHGFTDYSINLIFIELDIKEDRKLKLKELYEKR